MKPYNVCFWIYMVCAVFYLGFSTSRALAQEAPAAQTDPAPAALPEPAPADQSEPAASTDSATTPIVVEKGGILVQNKSPILVDITMPDQQPAPVVNNSIDFPDVMKTRDVGKSACSRSPGWCALGVGAGLIATIALGAYAADQAGLFDKTNTVGFQR